MSYGHPCSRITAGPLAGPASAYPTFSNPALICFSELKDVFVPGLIGGTSAWFGSSDRASAEAIVTSGAAARVITALRKKRRRCWLITSDVLVVLTGESPLLVRLVGMCPRWLQR